MAIERESPGAAHWGEREYHALFGNILAEGASNESSPPKRLCLVVVEMASEDAALAVAGFAVALCLGQEWEIENIVVDSALRRRGVPSCS